MAAINAQQIRKIYAIGNALGIVERGNEDDDLHALVSALTGKDSVKSLTYTEAQAVIADLQKRQGAAPLPRHKPKTHPERPGGATDGQQRKVWALMYQLAKADMAAYTAASRKNGKKYIPLIKNATQLYVIERGALCGVVLDGSYNLTEANYKTSLQNMVDRVLITDKDGNQIGVVEDTAAQQKYGVVQTVYKQEDGKDAQTEAKALLQTLEQTGSVTGCQGDSRAVSGYALIVQETTTGLFGKFYIESDTHTFTDGKHEMALTLAFSNMMDEKEIENQSQG